MNRLEFQAGQRIEIRQADDDASVIGWEPDTIELTVDGELDQCAARIQEGTLVIESQAALAIRVPRYIAVHISRASGDLVVRQLDGAISVGSVNGDLSIHSACGEITVDQAHARLTADQLTGALSVREVDGDVHLRNTSTVHLETAHGAVYAHNVDGDLDLGVIDGDVRTDQVAGCVTLEEGKSSFHGQGLHGGMRLNEVEGDLSLETSTTPGTTYRAHVRGTVDARFPAETSARFQLNAQGLVSAQLPEIELQEPGRVMGSAGAAEAEIVLQAGDDMSVQVYRPEEDTLDDREAFGSISSQIGAEMARHLAEMNVDALTERELDKTIRRAEKELQKAQLRLEQEQRRAREAARHAQEQAARAQERATRAARRAQEKLARTSRKWEVSGEGGPSMFRATPPQRLPRTETPGPSAEEQLAILEMLQQNKITVAEAEALLAALGGKTTRSIAQGAQP